MQVHQYTLFDTTQFSQISLQCGWVYNFDRT